MLINGVERQIAPHADLSDADLSGANLSDADLRDADLSDADLRGADLRDANLRGADLSGANLSGANLSGANLSGANLSGANLSVAQVCAANLRDADLRGADLRDANLSDANLSGADLRDAENIPVIAAARLSICPEGDLLVWKKLRGGVLCKLHIPADAKRTNATSRKCRAEFAVVLEGEGHSQHDARFTYRVGATVRPTEPFCEDRWQECARGIHFFLTREEAVAY